MSEQKPSGLELLRVPFPAHHISKLPKPYKKDSPAGKCAECGGYHGLPALHLDYVGHAALTDRLLDADPQWTWEPLATGPTGLPVLDEYGGLWIRLTVAGVTRLGYGHPDGKKNGNAIKEAIGDALRNAAMRFGAALDLWHKGGPLHLEADEADAEVPAAPVCQTPGACERWLIDMEAEAQIGKYGEHWTNATEQKRVHIQQFHGAAHEALKAKSAKAKSAKAKAA